MICIEQLKHSFVFRCGKCKKIYSIQDKYDEDKEYTCPGCKTTSIIKRNNVTYTTTDDPFAFVYIEPTKENVGSIHPLYGGILTDLMELPEDTCFHVANGLWNGVIITNEAGKKHIWPIGAEHSIPITDNNRYSLWIDKMQKPDDNEVKSLETVEDQTEIQKLARIGRQAMNIQRLDAIMASVDSEGKPVDGTEKCATFIYNLEKISEEEVKQLLNNDGYVSDCRILKIDLETADNIFPHSSETKNDNIRKYWKSRAYANDFNDCECSGCGFRVPAIEAVKIGNSSTDYVGVNYHFCPKCGSPMTYKQKE